jgi:beta-aspartyl-peptidase (threonine type)
MILHNPCGGIKESRAAPGPPFDATGFVRVRSLCPRAPEGLARFLYPAGGNMANRLAVAAHGGAGSTQAVADGPEAACRRAMETLRAGGDALQAVVSGTVLLEDDERFNAGTGSNLRLDGRTIEMDAALMTSDARFGGVACIRNVKNPILVALEVMKTPHILLCGEGAAALARARGFPEYDPISERAREKYRLRRAKLNARHFENEGPEWRRFDLDADWRGPAPREEKSSDTVGLVARDAAGHFAVANSTGGVPFMLVGRVGDSPIPGAGLYAGRSGAVAATGNGEEITRQLLCKQLYDWILAGMPVEEACRRGIDLFPNQISVGLIAVTAESLCGTSNRDMAWFAIEE